MAKKARFPLIMEGEIEVRDISSLREHFSLQKVMGYFAEGRLVTWLRDRYEDNLANEIEKLKPDDSNLALKICEIFDVSYEEIQEKIRETEERNRRLEKLKQYSSETEFDNNVDKIDKIAFDQDELYDFLDEGETVIYLCGDRFSIPLAKSGVKYIGVNNPTVVIDSKVEVDWEKLNIELVDIIYDEKYQKVLKNTEDTKKTISKNIYGKYYSQSFVDIPVDMKAAENSYNMLVSEIFNIKYEIFSDIEGIRKQIIDEGIIGLINSNISESKEWENKMDIRTAIKFEILIEDINKKIKRDGINVKSYDTTPLDLIFDKRQVNDFAKIIMNKATFRMLEDTKKSIPVDPWRKYNERDLTSKDPWSSMYGWKALIDKATLVNAARDFVKYCSIDKNRSEGYRLMFWSLMILTVDDSNGREKLSFICDLAKMLGISDDELMDITYVIKCVYNKADTIYEFKTKNIPFMFRNLLNEYKN